MGMNTAVSTRVMPITAPVISFMARDVASLGDSPWVAIRRSTFSTTTMASSTMMPMASTMPNMVRGVDGKAGQQHHREGAKQGDGGDDGRDQGVAQVLQEEKHHQEHQHHGFQQGVDHLVDGDLDEGAESNGIE